MVLPEELLTYVKEQLQQNVSIQQIIADAKSKGYQISSSTLYKMRASLDQQTTQTNLPRSDEARAGNESTTTIFKQFDAIPQFAKDQLLTAGVDILETKLVLKIHKNDEQLISKQYKISITVQDENFVTRVVQGVDQLLQNGSVNCVVVTSPFLVVDQRPRLLVFPNGLQVDLSQLMHHSNLYFVLRHHLTAMRYAKLFQKNVIFLQIDFETINACKCEAKSLLVTEIGLSHAYLSKLPQDNREVQKICKLGHAHCLTNQISGKTVSSGIRDAEIVAQYIAITIYNAVMLEQQQLFVLSGSMFGRLPATVTQLIKQYFMKLYQNFPQPISPEGLIYQANSESAIMGAVIFAQQHIKTEVVFETFYSVGNLNQSPLPLLNPLNFNVISQSPALQKQMLGPNVPLVSSTTGFQDIKPQSQSSKGSNGHDQEREQMNYSAPGNDIFSKLEAQTPINIFAGMISEDEILFSKKVNDEDDE